MTLSIKQNQFDAFFEAPFAAYGRTSPYVSLMKGDLRRMVGPENPTFQGASEQTYFTAHRDGRVVGRISAHDHVESNEIHGLSRGYFGFFDCIDDPAVAAALLRKAESWCRSRGHAEIAGNFNFTAMQQIGVVTEGFEHGPYTDLVWSPPHIAKLLDQNGYDPFFPMTTFEVDLTTAEPPVLGPKQQAILTNPDFKFAPINRVNVMDRMEDARLVLNASFAKNPMFVPVTHDEFHFQAKDMKWIVDPRISAVLRYKGAPAAVILCIPDFNPFLRRVGSKMGLTAPLHFAWHKMFNTRATLIFSGVIPELQGQGVNPLVLNRVMTEMKKAGYKTCGNTWIADENGASLAQKEKAGARKLHRLHLFRKDL